MNPATGYSIGNYGAMTADDIRINAYAAALRRSVTPESVVLDIGAGTGIWSLLACQYGARHVYAVEPDDSIQVAREVAKANGCADRITFLQDISTRIELPERAQVIVSDLRGTLPYFEQHIASIADARARHLAPGGVLIPRRDTVWAGLMEAPETCQRLLKPWGEDVMGIDFSSQRKVTTNHFHSEYFTPEELLASPQMVATLDYQTITDPHVHARLEWSVQRGGIAHGVSLWFQTELADGIGFATGPGPERMVYGIAFLLLTEPVAVSETDRVTLELKGNLVGNTYIWQWHTKFFAAGNTRLPATEFRQSTFDSSKPNLEQLRKRAAHYIPTTSGEAKVDRLVLNLMDGKTPLEDIARALAKEFPEQYRTWQQALSRVGDLAEKYT